MSNCASYTLGLALGLDVCGKVVRNWECKLRAARVHSFRLWQVSSYARLAEPLPQIVSAYGHVKKQLRISVQRIRSDATNTLVWQKCKMNVLEVDQ